MNIIANMVTAVFTEHFFHGDVLNMAPKFYCLI